MLQGVIVTSTDLEILVGGGRGEGGGVVHKNPIPHCRPNERRKINILHFKDLFLFYAKSTYLRNCSNLQSKNQFRYHI